MRWHYTRHARPRRYFYGTDLFDFAWVERSRSNPKMWDVHVYEPSFGTMAYSLIEAKRIVEGKLREAKKAGPVRFPHRAGAVVPLRSEAKP